MVSYASLENAEVQTLTKSNERLKTLNKKLDEKNRYHISWKNNGIDQYIKQAFVTYSRKKEMI